MPSLSADGRSHESASASAGSRDADTAGAGALPCGPLAAAAARRHRSIVGPKRSGGQWARTWASSAGRPSARSASSAAASISFRSVLSRPSPPPPTCSSHSRSHTVHAGPYPRWTRPVASRSAVRRSALNRACSATAA
eukprot:scaffold1640_cov111-Isochrysis_galbana.AAC.25